MHAINSLKRVKAAMVLAAVLVTAGVAGATTIAAQISKPPGPIPRLAFADWRSLTDTSFPV